MEYSRPSDGWRFELGGLNVKDAADALPYHKQTIAINVRAATNKSIRTRPGYNTLFTTVNNGITDIRAFSEFEAGNAPRYLARNTSNQIYLDNGTNVGQLTGTDNGVFMIPFRPNAAVAPWMYIAGSADYEKISSPGAQPSGVGLTTKYKVGIRENQTAPTVSPRAFSHYDFMGVAANWTPSGTAGATADSGRPNDTIGFVIADPASNNERWSIQISDVLDGYQIHERIVIDSAGLNFQTVVEDVLPAIVGTYTVQSIYYFTGSSGRALVVPNQLSADPTIPTFSGTTPSASALTILSEVAALRRGSLITINGDKCLILSVIVAPNGTVALEILDNTGGHSNGQLIVGVSAVVVGNITASASGKTLTVPFFVSTVTTGTGYLVRNLATNPFTQQLSPLGVVVQTNDYVAIQFNISDISKVVGISISFDVNNGSADFVTNTFYRNFVPADLLGFTPSAVTSFATSPWYTLFFPISTLTRLGADTTRTLQNCQAIRVGFTVTGSTQFELSGLHVGGGGAPDVGNNAPYFYTFIGRSSVTGAIGNPAPITRYGVNPRRQPVYVNITDTTSDLQVDTWDVYRFGGTVNSWHYIGSIAKVAGGTATFTDNFFDTSALAGNLLDFTNYEPWPSIDVPFSLVPGVVGAVTSAINLYGGAMILVWSSASPFTNPAPANILSWLPGTLIQLGGQSAYTLYSRPTAVTLTNPPNTNYFAYLVETVQSMGSGTAASMLVLEPNIANQHLYAIWGPDATGTIFGCGDPLRPGVLYWNKPYNPDSAPNTNNLEISTPSEPLLGGEVIDGLSYVASTKRWWAAYPQTAALAAQLAGTAVGSSAYQVVERPFGHPLAAKYGHCTDGKFIYYWGKDGIYMSAGGEAISLTEEDLKPLFPRGEAPGVNITYNGKTFYAPDYTRSDGFRLSIYNGYLYADYQDTNGTYRNLTLDMHPRENTKMAWVMDAYKDSILCHYGLERSSNVLLMGALNGNVKQSQDLHNDDNTTIVCDVATFEYNGGDERAEMLWGDLFFDVIPASPTGVSATPVSAGVNINAGTFIASSTGRQRSPVSLSGGAYMKFMGVRLHWVDDFTQQTIPTSIHIWQPSFIPKPAISLDKFTDWDDAGYEGNKYFQGFILEADTNNVAKSIQIRDADSQALHTIQPTTVIHNSQQELAYSFVTPFKAHMVRIEPQDTVAWRYYKAKWIFEPTPENSYTWVTQGTSFGLPGYKFVHRVVAAYSSTAPVTITITTYDGISPAVVTLPSTNGAYQKTLFVLTFNKGQLYFFSGVSSAPWQSYVNDWEVHVGQWGREKSMLIWRNLGSEHGVMARI